MNNGFFNKTPMNQNPNDIGAAFENFMNQFRGQSPRDIINQFVSSGQITQYQLNVAQQQAQQMSGMLEKFKKMFGF